MTEFSLRIFLTDYYLAKPVPHVDDVFNDFTNKENFQVPIIRIYGTTPRGQKCCAHIHGVFPYFYVPFTEDSSLINDKDNLDRYLLQFSCLLNESIKNSLDYKPSSCNFIYRIVLVKGKPFYGYQDTFQYFLKIYLLNPTMVQKAGDLLLSGSVMGRAMQPFETHISYNLKFFIDYNLYGMNFLFTDGVKFRLDKDCQGYPEFCELSDDMFVNLSQKYWNAEDIIYGNNLMDRKMCPKMSSCELEVDISACDILNALEVEGNIGQNPGLKNLWEEEKRRRLSMGLDVSELVGEVFEERPLAQPTKSEKNLMMKWQEIVNSVRTTEEENPSPNLLNVELEVDEFIGGSESDDSLSDQELSFSDPPNRDLIVQTAETGGSSVGQSLQIPNEDDDDDHVIQEFIKHCLEEEANEGIIQSDASSHIGNQSKNIANDLPRTFSPVEQPCHEPVLNEIIELDSESDSDDLFDKTFIDLSLDDSSDEESPDESPNPDAKNEKEKPNNDDSCEDLFGDDIIFSDTSSENEDISVLETYDGADDEISGDEFAPKKAKYIKLENQVNPNLIRSPIATRSRNKQFFDTEQILIPLITKKLEMEKKNRKKKCRLSMKLKSKPTEVESHKNIPHEEKSTVSNMETSTTYYEDTNLMISQVPKIRSKNSSKESSQVSPELDTIKPHSSSLLNDESNINLSPTPNRIPEQLFSTPAGLKTKSLTQQFMNISPIRISPLNSQRNKSKKHISFTIPEVSQESPHSSPLKMSTSTLFGRDKKSEKLTLLESMKLSVHEHSHNVSGNTSMMSNKLIETCHLTLLSVELFSESQLNKKPNPKSDPILMIFYAVHDVADIPEEDSFGNQRINRGIIYINNADADPMREAGIISVDNQNLVPVSNETELLDKVIELVWEFDPEILVGFETERSSWGYLIERAFNLKHKLFSGLGRLLERSGESKKIGFYESLEKEFKISELHYNGRMILNLWILLKYELPLTSYSVEKCADEVLKERIPHYTNQQLLAWYKSNNERYLVVNYYNYRVLANLRLLDKLNLVSRTSEFAKIYGIEFYHVLSRGSQYRVESMMLRLAKPQNLIAISPSVKQRARQKAPECIPLTLEPLSGLYRDPVVVLDFQSLYPSVMIAYNYCFATTLGKLEHIKGVEREKSYELGCVDMELGKKTIQNLKSNVTISPNGVAFVRPEIEKGIISKMVEEILNTRIMIKKSMKIHAHNKALCKLLDSRQLGLKLIANVTFGYTAASYSGRMPCVEVGDSIVRKSRETLEETIKLVNSGGPNGIAKLDNEGGWSGCKVIYGDTDSVFILMPKRTKDEAFILGARIADAVSALNPFPVKLKFEKVYWPCLLEAKKKYVGFSYESPDQVKPKFDAKGIETVRRDNCGIVSKILERTLTRLFSSDNTDSVKRYVTQELSKILRGEVNLIDFIIAKEFRGRQRYAPGASIPALHIARELAKKDSRAEPLRGDRVPYVIIQGAPGDTLISCVRRPEDIMFNTNYFKAYATNIRMLNEQGCKLSYTYYITKQILPPLNRALSLVDMDVFKWYSQLPKRFNSTGHRQRAQLKNNFLNRTISSYFQTQNCLLCHSIVKASNNDPIDSFAAVFCSDCIQKGKQNIYFNTISQLKDIEDCRKSVLEQCYACTGNAPSFRGIGPPCVSKDCEIFFNRIRAFQQPTSDLEEILNSKAFHL